MNFYQHHIGDFNNATRHLTRIERSIYRDLLELYYDTESPLTSDFDRLARRCIVDDCDRAAMCDVLNEFFILQEDGYHNTRADREIAAFKRMAEGGKRGADKRWGKPTDSHPIATPLPPQAKANANHEPITNNHKPVTKEYKAQAPTAYADLLIEVSPQVVDDWKQLRKTKKAAVTRTVVEQIIVEAGKAGYTLERALSESCARGWTGFKAEWVGVKTPFGSNPNKQEALEERNRAVGERWALAMMQKAEEIIQ